MVYIFSTLTGGQDYCLYERISNGNVILKKKISINGGANVANKKLYTPKGVVTSVSDEDYEVLKQISEFNNHVARGFLKVQKTKQDADEAVHDLQEKDATAPLTDQSLSGVDEVESGNKRKRKGK